LNSVKQLVYSEIHAVIIAMSEIDEATNDLKKPDAISKYVTWLRTEHKIEDISKEKNYYRSIAFSAKRDFEKTNFWIDLNEMLEDYEQEYLLKTGYDLVSPTQKAKVLVKPFNSLLNKSYRKNILENEKWPNPPEKGWILPNNWLSSINDILRTLFVVKYFDGVSFLTEKISCLCAERNMPCAVDFEAREEGYYAAHINTKCLFEIPKRTWDTRKVNFSIEIQVTTQVQEVIRKLLHKYYAVKRIKLEKRTSKWQWDHKCDEFASNYLGHILHYVEGMILEIRDKQKEKTI